MLDLFESIFKMLKRLIYNNVKMYFNASEISSKNK